MPRKAQHKLEAEANGTRFEDLVPDAALRSRMMGHLIEGKALMGEGSPFSELLQRAINDVLDAEMDGFQSEQAAAQVANKRNGYTAKTVRSAAGNLAVRTPRDRNGEFAPQLIAKRQEQLHTGLDEQVLALYAQGNSCEDIHRLVTQLYGVELSTAKISQITDQVIPRINAWVGRPLASCYAIVYLDAMVFTVRTDGQYGSRASYTCYGIDAAGQRDILGFYFTEAEGASAWGRILEDVRARGVEDILICCVDGLAGFSEVIGAVFPKATVQRCVVHAVRSATQFVDDKDRKALHAQLRRVYQAPTLAQADAEWIEFAQQWGGKYPGVIKKWEQGWPELQGYFGFGEDLRRMIYTTNPVEAVHRIVRKLVKGKAAWTSELALTKQLYLSLMHNEKSWRRQAYRWTSVQRELARRYGERYLKHLAA